MNSIRSQLFAWLLPSFLIIATLAVASLCISEKKRLEDNLDNELSKLERAVKLANRIPSNRFSPPLKRLTNISENTKRILANEDLAFYLQVSTDTGNIISKSDNLGEQQITHENQAKQVDKHFYDSQLTSGEVIRIHTFNIKGGPRDSLLNVSIAISKNAAEQQLTSFSLKVILGGLICCVLLAVISAFAIRKALIPLKNLSEQVATVEAGSLSNRLTTEYVPTEISPLVKRLNQLLARLEFSFAKERQFNNDLAHELRTPLAAIRTTSEVALKWPEQSSIDDHQYIADSSAQLQHTIDSLLSLARIENSEKEIQTEDVSISTIVDECLALHNNLIKERELTFNLAIDKQFTVKSDPHLLRIIISNLINNATEYAPPNSEIIIESNLEGSILSVMNMAPNLNQYDLETMFDRLWRKDGSRTGTQHVGLGLSIASTSAKALSLELTAKLYDNQTLEMRLR